MTAQAESFTKGPPRLVGQVFAEITIRNGFDVALVRAGSKRSDEVRQLFIDRVLVDTGATHICLPTAMIDELGLEILREVTVAMASGTGQARIVGPAEIEIAGRTTFVEVLELPGGQQPLLGVVPMETLGLEPDLRKQRLKVLPESGPQTHLTAY